MICLRNVAISYTVLPPVVFFSCIFFLILFLSFLETTVYRRNIYTQKEIKKRVLLDSIPVWSKNYGMQMC